MAKKKIYMVLDTETCSFPWLNEIADTDEKRKKIAIAKPLIYDFGYVLTDRMGNTLKKVNYLVAETFAVPSVFNTAYYKEKRPLYLDMIRNGEIEVKPWEEIVKIFENDLSFVDAVGAFNAAFDFFKAIPTTELYIKHLYSPDYHEWEEVQKRICWKIANEPYKKNENKEYDPEHFRFRGNVYDLFDIWGLSVENLLNTAKYRKLCFELGMLTGTGEYFKTSAESTFRYVCAQHDFDEAHTALDDAMIEATILSKIAKRKAVRMGVDAFPFRNLGTTVEWARNHKMKTEHIDTILDIMREKIETYNDGSAYRKRLEKYVKELEQMR